MGAGKTQANLEAALVAHDAFLAGCEGARPAVVVADGPQHASELRERLDATGGADIEVVPWQVCEQVRTRAGAEWYWDHRAEDALFASLSRRWDWL